MKARVENVGVDRVVIVGGCLQELNHIVEEERFKGEIVSQSRGIGTKTTNV